MEIEDDRLDREINRDRGMLTKSDRAFLSRADAGTPDNENARNQKRFRIRRRIRDSIQDFVFLIGMPTEDYRLLEEDYHADKGEIGLHFGMLATIQFLYRLLGEEEFLRLTEIVIAMARGEGEAKSVRANINITIEELEHSFDDLSEEGDSPTHESELPELAQTVVEIMKELDEGDGAPTKDVVETVIEREGVGREQAEEAIEDALLAGQCYEPVDGTLKPI